MIKPTRRINILFNTPWRNTFHAIQRPHRGGTGATPSSVRTVEGRVPPRPASAPCSRTAGWRGALLLITAALLITSCGRSPEPAETPAAINRVISMAPSITECIFAVGGGERVVGVTTYCNYPPEANTRPRIGGYADANFEAIYALKPDLVFLLDEHHAAAKRLDALGIAHHRLDTSTIPNIFNTLRTLGTLFNTEAQTEELITNLELRMSALTPSSSSSLRVKNRPTKRKVLISIGRNMGTGGLSDIYVAGKNTLYQEMLDLIDAQNVYDGPLEYAKIAYEGIMRLAPDVIIDLIPDLETSTRFNIEEVRNEWNILKGIPAIENNEVHVFGGDHVCIPGPRFILTLEEIANAIYPCQIQQSNTPTIQ